MAVFGPKKPRFWEGTSWPGASAPRGYRLVFAHIGVRHHLAPTSSTIPPRSENPPQPPALLSRSESGGGFKHVIRFPSTPPPPTPQAPCCGARVVHVPASPPPCETNTCSFSTPGIFTLRMPPPPPPAHTQVEVRVSSGHAALAVVRYARTRVLFQYDVRPQKLRSARRRGMAELRPPTKRHSMAVQQTQGNIEHKDSLLLVVWGTAQRPRCPDGKR